MITSLIVVLIEVRTGFAAGGEGIRTLGSAPPLRDRWFADSPLEVDGFEPSVPRRLFLAPPVDRPNSSPQYKPAPLATETEESNPPPSNRELGGNCPAT